MDYNPIIILKCLSTQATYINKLYGQMFYYTDKGEIWYDTQLKSRIQAKDIFIVSTEKERVNTIFSNNIVYYNNNMSKPSVTPINANTYTYVYVIETNSLYSYNYASNSWLILYGVYGSTTVAQTYLPDGNAVIINADDVSTNGILNDGSVVIRDKNKMICGLLLSDGYSFYIKSLIGQQINLDPSGNLVSNGCLQLNAGDSANLNGDLTVFGSLKITNKENWDKQFKLLQENVSIVSYTLIKKGSTIKAGSNIDGKSYPGDEILNEDITTSQTGVIALGSKIYINSIINNTPLVPPYLFDLTINDVVSTMTTSLDIDSWGIQDNENNTNTSTLMVEVDCPFVNSGDTVFIKDFKIKTDGVALNTITSMVFADGNSFNIDYIDSNITNTARIIYYKQSSSVKILI